MVQDLRQSLFGSGLALTPVDLAPVASSVIKKKGKVARAGAFGGSGLLVLVAAMIGLFALLLAPKNNASASVPRITPVVINTTPYAVPHVLGTKSSPRLWGDGNGCEYRPVSDGIDVCIADYNPTH
jgi:hypothetical protein